MSLSLQGSPLFGGGRLEMNVAARTQENHCAMKTVGWLSVSLGAVALGVIIGREIRCRYKFKRRTPYDLYSHSGDRPQGVEFGMGV